MCPAPFVDEIDRRPAFEVVTGCPRLDSGRLMLTPVWLE